MKKQKHLLILHNGTKPNGAHRVARWFEDRGLQASVYWAYNNQFPNQLDMFDGCFITGSPHGAYEDIPWIHKEHKLIQKMAEQELPILGVCFGSQILGSALCGRDQLFRRTACEVGFLSLQMMPQAQTDLLTAQLGESLNMFVWHNDEVRATHPDMVILASTLECPNQIWRYKNMPIWGVQGHPELTRASALTLFDEDRAVFERDGADIANLKATAHDAPEAKTLLTQFVKVVEQAGVYVRL